MTRADPFSLVFAELAEGAFAPIQREIERTGQDIDNRDAFLLLGSVGSALRSIVPAEAPAESIEQHAALLHHAFRYWRAGRHLVQLDGPRLAPLLTTEATTTVASLPSAYVQLPERKVWASLADGSTAEPLDGVFLTIAGDELDLLAVFGLHESRRGFSVVPARGPVDPILLQREARRADGGRTFTSLLPGGTTAGLHSVATVAELLLLGLCLAALVPPSPESPSDAEDQKNC